MHMPSLAALPCPASSMHSHSASVSACERGLLSDGARNNVSLSQDESVLGRIWGVKGLKH